MVALTRSTCKTSSNIDDRLYSLKAGPTVRHYNSQPWREWTPWSVLNLRTMNVVASDVRSVSVSRCQSRNRRVGWCASPSTYQCPDTPRSRTELTGSTLWLPISSGSSGSWCRRRIVGHTTWMLAAWHNSRSKSISLMTARWEIKFYKIAIILFSSEHNLR